MNEDCGADGEGQTISGVRRAKFLSNMLTYAFRAYHEHMGREGFPLREVVALAAVTHPELFESRRLAVDVEVSGELTRGTTVADIEPDDWY